MPETYEQMSYDTLVLSGLMEVRPLNDQFSIGTIAHGPALQKAIADGKLHGFLNEFGDLYREIYGREPWNEYLVCTNKECKKKEGIRGDISLAEADGKFLSNPQEFTCNGCGSPMEFFYPQEKTVKNITEGFKQKIYASLLFGEKNKDLSGFSLGWATTVGEGYRDKMIVGTGDPPETNIGYDEYLQELRRILGSPYPENTKAYNAAEWGTSQKARGAKAALPLLHAVFSTAQKKMEETPGEEIPVIAHTLVGSTAFRLVKKIGWATGPERDGTDEIRLYSTLKTLMKGIEKIIQ